MWLFEELSLSSAGEQGREEDSQPDWGRISIQEEERHHFLTKQGHWPHSEGMRRLKTLSRRGT